MKEQRGLVGVGPGAAGAARDHADGGKSKRKTYKNKRKQKSFWGMVSSTLRGGRGGGGRDGGPKTGGDDVHGSDSVSDEEDGEGTHFKRRGFRFDDDDYTGAVAGRGAPAP